ncbi:hypothetical protein EX30DRAFT_343367 [Ascodesmis nigricans]|uniref:Uncharacterized protein n=1 Tax=Ascodesmis nigricans TaxID=341454 RepID=A0A4S2MRB0_9PEZI|nr:hypothetical protein EX30DRAFT_343367 [Ascodesmis nigricans]
MLTISLLAALVPATVQAITAYDPIVRYEVPYTTLTSSSFSAFRTFVAYDPIIRSLVPYTTLTVDIYTYSVHFTATLASSPASATPFSTHTATVYWDSYLTWITYHFSSEDVPTPWVTIPSTTSKNDYLTSTVWYEQTVLTAPSYCSSTAWTHTTSGEVEIPQEVHYQLTPITTITSTYTLRYKTTKLTSTYLTFVLTPSAVVHPPTTTTTTWPPTDPCRSPTPTSFSSRLPEPPFHRNVAIGVCTAIALLLVLGFLENYYWFVRLMTGRWALRLGTVSWCLSTVVGVCLTRISRSRTPEQQRVLAQRWNEIPGTQKWRLWWMWGFRWKYPAEILGNMDGPAPAVGVVYQPPPPMYEETSTTTSTTMLTSTTMTPVQGAYLPPYQGPLSYGSPPPPYIPHPPPQT